jgi:hypothetical protein
LGVGAVAVLALGLLTILWLRPDPARVPADAGTPGRLVASTATVDLGRVPFDELVEAHFELANTGGGTVRLTGKPKVQMLEGC